VAILEKETKHAPKAIRYPLFLAGLIVLVGGGVIGEALKLSTNFFVAVAVVGFLLLMAAVIVR
jgi:hypothetical protein